MAVDCTRRSVAVLLPLVGCSEPGALVEVHITTNASDHAVEHVLEGVSELLEIDLERVDERGSGVLELRFAPGHWDAYRWRNLCGEAVVELYDADSPEPGLLHCRPFAWACPNPTLAAHEIGHVFGLEHASDENNLMYWAPQTDDYPVLSGKQLRKVWRQAANFRRDCGR